MGVREQVAGARGQETGGDAISVSADRNAWSTATDDGRLTTRKGQTRPPSAPHSSPVTPHRPSVARHSIEVHLEELVLNGFDPRDRHRIGDAVERELARLFAEQGVPGTLAEPTAIDRLDVGAFRVKPPSRPEKVGAQVAQAVYSSLRSSLPQGGKSV